LGILLLAMAVFMVVPQLRSGTEMVRARHALSLGPELASLGEMDWTPAQWPSDYRRDQPGASSYFAGIARNLRLTEADGDWTRALLIGRHLLGSAPRLNGGAIQQNLHRTHEEIVHHGNGYCGDFVRVFVAIANAAGMHVRPWAFSFDGFGGHGHVWVEVWRAESGDWALLDVFQNYYYSVGDGPPLSARSLHEALTQRKPGLRLNLIDHRVPPGWAIEAKAHDYLLRGLDGWYVPWGANVHEVDAAALVKALSFGPRAVTDLAAIISGMQPQLRLLAQPSNERARADMRSLRLRLLFAVVFGLGGAILLLWPRARGPAHTMTSGEAQVWPRVCIVGPLPPPSGGMANQCDQLVRLLRREGARVDVVQTNAPYTPSWVAHLPILRAGARLFPYLWALWRAAGRNDVLHLLANSGWAWHLHAAPAVWIARWREVPVIVNYRGGLADEFLSRAPSHVKATLRRAALCVTPSPYLERVFARHGLRAEIIPNIVDLDRFRPHEPRAFGDSPHIVVARNLEPIYGLTTAIEALALLRETYAGARMTIAGSGPQRHELETLARSLGLADAVCFPGRIEHGNMPDFYASADAALNPSTVDNMPNSVLEAYASHLPLVSTNVGGVPDIVDDGASGLLVPAGDAAAMAQALSRVLDDRALAGLLVSAGAEKVKAFGWSEVKEQWRQAYRRTAAGALP
jgi:glycosyltransferase involved in cell wall biosynthesis